MPMPSHCPNPACPAHIHPTNDWLRPFGSYHTAAHGTVLRFRCRHCGTTCSTQTESMHYAAKRRLPLKAIATSLLEGASQREIARRYHTSPMAVHNAVVRLGRQAIAAESLLLNHLSPRDRLVFDGLRSFVTSQDYPCDLTTLVDAESETILAITHGLFLRAGRRTRAQQRRIQLKRNQWQIPKGTMSRAISLIWDEIWNYLSVRGGESARIDTDRNYVYRRLGLHSPAYRFMQTHKLAVHRTTSSTAPRTHDNPLFPVNYVDRLVRHRLREHTRETIAFGRHSAMQLYRMWVFAWDLNTQREWRVKQPREGTHAAHGALDGRGRRVIRRRNRAFFQRRIDVSGYRVPASLVDAWRADVVTPPIRWKVGQKGTSVRLSQYVIRDMQRAAV